MNSINYKHLHYFWVVAKEGSIARASEQLHLTPQTISGQLSLLEKSVGKKLFSRSGRNLVLTEAGRTALEYADDIFLLGAELQNVLSNRAVEGSPLRLSIGITDVIPKLIAHRLIEPALQLDEPVRIICHEDSLDNLLTDIAAHKLDVVISDRPIRPSMNVRAFNHHLGSCGISFFAAAELAEKYQAGFPHSLDQAPMLLPVAGNAIRREIMQWFDSLEIRPIIVGEFDDSALIKTFGQAGVGIFAAPTVITKDIERQHNVFEIGATDKIHEEFYAISPERKLKHPGVIAINDSAHQNVFPKASG